MPRSVIPVVMPHNASQNTSSSSSSSTNSDGNAANSANAEKIAELEKEVDDLKKENKHMADNMRHISNMLTTNKRKSPYDALFNRAMNKRYKGTSNGGPIEWNVHEPFCHPDNQAVKETLINYCRTYFTKVPDHWYNPLWCDEKAENHYRHRRDQARKSATQRTEEGKRKRDHGRRVRKVNNRARVTRENEALKASLEVEFPGFEALLGNQVFMSDEEDVMAEDGVSVTTKVFRPAWRSERANDFLARVDAAGRQPDVNNRAWRQQRIRGNITIEVVQMEVPSSVPAWAINDNNSQ